jgi:GNAT superfamily N-acetyltransferase
MGSVNKMVRIQGFDPRYLPVFIELNRQWIEKYFVIEPMDIAQLENPYESILNPGGEIFFVMKDEKPVGTCAMVPHGEDYELAKMAVLPEARGEGFGDLLMECSIEWAKMKGAKKIIILSNTVLEPAIRLYKKHGFRTKHLGAHSDYSRCNIEMEMDLQKIQSK